MRLISCQRCGSGDLVASEGVLVCPFCRARYSPDTVAAPLVESTIGVAADVQALLEKCRNEPWNRRRYASLALDIDPKNAEALRYLT